MFQLVTADFAVYQHMKENPELYSEKAVNDVRALLLNEPRLDSKIKETIMQETEVYRGKQSTMDDKLTDDISNVNHCLENVHLYADGQTENDAKSKEDHREAMAHHSKGIIPYHEPPRDECQSIRKTVSFDDGLL